MKGVLFMEDRLKSALDESEKIIWYGTPQKIKLFSAPDKVSQYVAWGVTALMFLFSFGYFLPNSIVSGREMSAIIIALVVFNFVPLTIAIRPFLDKRQLEKNTIYAITDKRVIAIVKDKVHALPRDNSLVAAVTEHDGKTGNLCFNAAITAPVKKSRTNAVLGCSSEDHRTVRGIVFYHIANPEALGQYFAA